MEVAMRGGKKDGLRCCKISREISATEVKRRGTQKSSTSRALEPGRTDPELRTEKREARNGEQFVTDGEDS